MEGSEQGWVVHVPHSWLQAGNSLLTAPTLQPEAPCCPLPWPPRPLLLPLSQEKTVIKWCLSLQLPEKLLHSHLAQG